MKEKIFKIIGNNQKNPFRGDGTICNCLPAAMGMGGGMCHIYFQRYAKQMIRICAIRGRSDGDWYNSEHKQRLEIGGELSNSITSVLKDNYIFETNNHFMEEKKEKTPRPEGKGWCWDEKNGKWFRIRKLTPRECFRLMDVTDADFDKLLVIETTGKDNKPKRVISDSQLYKMAGNSIVVSCMYLIFENLFFPKKRIDLLF